MTRVALSSFVTAIVCYLAFGIISGSSMPVVDGKCQWVPVCAVIPTGCDPVNPVFVWRCP